MLLRIVPFLWPAGRLGRPFISEALFATITNANFDAARRDEPIQHTIARRDALKATIGFDDDQDAVTRNGPASACATKGARVGLLSQCNDSYSLAFIALKLKEVLALSSRSGTCTRMSRP